MRRTAARKAEQSAIAKDAIDILEKMNSSAEEIRLSRYAQYFANSKTAKNVRMVDVDGDGFTLQYLEKDHDTNNWATKEIRIQFDSFAHSTQQVLKKLDEMEYEARVVLNMKVNKNYVPPGRDELKLLQLPSFLGFILCTLFWAGLYIMVFHEEALPDSLETLRLLVGGRNGPVDFLRGILILNVTQAFGALFVSYWAEFPLSVALTYFLLTLPFGIITLGTAVRVGYKHREKLERESEIGLASNQNK